ncbi:possible pseudogene (fragment) of probable glycoside hydrolase, family 10 (Interpro) [Aromatoleum aromaticum EbN1]
MAPFIVSPLRGTGCVCPRLGRGWHGRHGRRGTACVKGRHHGDKARSAPNVGRMSRAAALSAAWGKGIGMGWGRSTIRRKAPAAFPFYARCKYTHNLCVPSYRICIISRRWQVRRTVTNYTVRGRATGASRAPAATRSSLLVVILILFRHLEAEQCGPKLIGCCCQQPLGLDARLDGLIEPDEIEHHVAHQRQVMGNVADAAPCVVVTELNIQTPVQPILDFPMTSDRQCDSLGIARQTADVVRALGTGALAHRSHALDDGKAGHVLPGSSLVEPIGRVIRRTASHFDPSVARARALVRRARRQRAARIDVREDDRVKQLRMVVLHAQHVVCTPLTDGARDLGLRAHRIDGDDAAVDVEHLEQFGVRIPTQRDR